MSESREGTSHEWYWGNGRPCCVNCGVLADCKDSRDTVTRAVMAEADLAALREAAQALFDAADESWLVPDRPERMDAAFDALRAVLASADSEEER
jgi:hypothetical protein